MNRAKHIPVPGRAAVAVDGGQTGIRVRIASHTEVLETKGLGRLEGDVAAGLASRVAECLAELPGGAPAIGRMVWGLTVAPAGREAREALARELGAAFGASRVDVCGDELTAHAGAFGGGTGVVLAVGTGIACLGMDLDAGVMRRVDGDGFLLGDAGAAFWLGSRGVEAVLRARDGRGSPTSLEAACLERYGEHHDLAVWLHSQQRAVAAIALFAIDVQRAAAAGDAVARRLVEAAADELVHTARTAAAGLSPRPCPLALSGRAVAEGSALRRAVIARLDRSSDGLVLAPASGDPLGGAWAIAEGRLGDRYAEFLSTWSASGGSHE